MAHHGHDSHEHSSILRQIVDDIDAHTAA